MMLLRMMVRSSDLSILERSQPSHFLIQANGSQGRIETGPLSFMKSVVQFQLADGIHGIAQVLVCSCQANDLSLFNLNLAEEVLKSIPDASC
jgi:hypothetical protein